jgi:hypothetical protein
MDENLKYLSIQQIFQLRWLERGGEDQRGVADTEWIKDLRQLADARAEIQRLTKLLGVTT